MLCYLEISCNGPCGAHVVFIPGIRFSILKLVNIPGHVVTNDETSSPPLCRSCSLILNMHLSNYYETGPIYLLDVESSPSKYRPVMSIYQVASLLYATFNKK